MKSRSIFFAFGIGTILAIAYTVFHYTKSYNDKFEVSIITCDASVNNNSLTLYYDTGKGFSEKHTVKFKETRNQYVAKVSLSKKQFLKTIRLDFNDSGSFCLQQLTLYNKKQKIIYELNGNEIKSSIVHVSDGVVSIKEQGGAILIETDISDPYVFFKPNFFITAQLFTITLLLLIPYILTFCLIIYKVGFVGLDILVFSLIIVSIPLKDSLTSFAAILFVLYVFYNIIIRRNKMLLSPILALVFIFLLPTIAGILDGVNDNYGIRLGALVFPLGFAFVRLKKDQIKQIYIIYSSLMLIIALFVISVFIIYLIIGEIDLKYILVDKQKMGVQKLFLYLKYNHPTFLGMFMLIGFVLKWFEKDKRFDMDLILYLLVIFTFSVLTSARVVLFSLLFILCVLVFIKKLKFFHFCLISTFSLTLVFLGTYFLDDFRIGMWRLMLSSNDWLLGNGFGSSENIIFETFGEKFHPHNQFLLWFYEFGLLGLLFFVMLFTSLLCFFVKTKNLKGVSVLLLINILMMTEAPFETSKPVFILSFLLSLLCFENYFNTKFKECQKQIK